MDAIWATGINVAATEHLRFGREILFTYGPWGFLDAPEITDAWHAAAAFAFGLAATAALYAAAYTAFRRAVKTSLAAPAAFAFLPPWVPSGPAGNCCVRP